MEATVDRKPRSHEERLRDLEDAHTVNKTRYATIIMMGVAFWGVSSKLVYDKLDSIDAALEQLTQVQAEVNILEFRADQQDGFNGRLMASEAEYKRQVQATFDRLSDQMNSIYRSNAPARSQ